MAAFAFDRNYPGISVYKALTNKELSEDEKAEIIAEAIETISKEFPNLKNVATKQDLSETELRLLKEIKELDVKSEQIRNDLTKEIKNLDNKLTREIKELDVKSEQIRNDLTKEIEKSKVETIKWVTILMIGQIFTISGIVTAIFKFFLVK